jgi:ComF family protein
LAQEDEYCGDCKGRKTSFQYGYGLFVYNSLMQESVARFKYHGRQEYAYFYALELKRIYGEWLRQVSPAALIPVPVHPKRFQKRGYNQAELIARRLGKLTGIPVKTDLIFRQKDTLAQKELSEQERRQNLKDAFFVKKHEELNLLKECVILIDDIYTTGSTIEECSRVLRQAGIQKIFFLCVCIGKGY